MAEIGENHEKLDAVEKARRQYDLTEVAPLLQDNAKNQPLPDPGPHLKPALRCNLRQLNTSISKLNAAAPEFLPPFTTVYPKPFNVPAGILSAPMRFWPAHLRALYGLAPMPPLDHTRYIGVRERLHRIITKCTAPPMPRPPGLLSPRGRALMRQAKDTAASWPPVCPYGPIGPPSKADTKPVALQTNISQFYPIGLHLGSSYDYAAKRVDIGPQGLTLPLPRHLSGSVAAPTLASLLGPITPPPQAGNPSTADSPRMSPLSPIAPPGRVTPHLISLNELSTPLNVKISKSPSPQLCISPSTSPGLPKPDSYSVLQQESSRLMSIGRIPVVVHSMSPSETGSSAAAPTSPLQSSYRPHIYSPQFKSAHPDQVVTPRAPVADCRGEELGAIVFEDPFTDNQYMDMRIVFLIDVPERITLHILSNTIRSEGAVYSIKFGRDTETGKRFAGVIFEHASSASLFLDRQVRESKSSAPRKHIWPYHGHSTTPMLGPPFEATEDIRKMSTGPERLRRRLTVTQANLFRVWPIKEFQALCLAVAGEEDVQWVFVSSWGEGSACFGSCESARKVELEIEKLEREGAERVWRGTKVTYGADPCERRIEFPRRLPGCGQNILIMH